MGRYHYIKMTTKKTNKKNYLKPTVSVFSILEENCILAASPDVRPGGDGKPAGPIQVIDGTPATGEDNDELWG